MYILGVVFFLCKPPIVENEYDINCCDLSGVMFDIDLVERKDHPR